MARSGYLLLWNDPNPELLEQTVRDLSRGDEYPILIAPVAQSSVVFVARPKDRGTPDVAFARLLSTRVDTPVVAFCFDEDEGGYEWVSAWEGGLLTYGEEVHWTVPGGWFGPNRRRSPQRSWPISRLAAGFGLSREELFSFEFEFLPTIYLRADLPADLVTFALTWAPLRNLRTSFPRARPDPDALRRLRVVRNAG